MWRTQALQPMGSMGSWLGLVMARAFAGARLAGEHPLAVTRHKQSSLRPPIIPKGGRAAA